MKQRDNPQEHSNSRVGGAAVQGNGQLHIVGKGCFETKEPEKIAYLGLQTLCFTVLGLDVNFVKIGLMCIFFFFLTHIHVCGK
jgi:hypothetical protein